MLRSEVLIFPSRLMARFEKTNANSPLLWASATITDSDQEDFLAFLSGAFGFDHIHFSEFRSELVSESFEFVAVKKLCHKMTAGFQILLGSLQRLFAKLERSCLIGDAHARRLRRHVRNHHVKRRLESEFFQSRLKIQLQHVALK